MTFFEFKFHISKNFLRGFYWNLIVIEICRFYDSFFFIRQKFLYYVNQILSKIKFVNFQLITTSVQMFSVKVSWEHIDV